MTKTWSVLKKGIANEISSYVEGTIEEWYKQHPEVGEPKFTLGMTDSLLDGLFTAYAAVDRIDSEVSHRSDVVEAVTMPLWNRYIDSTVSTVLEHEAAWNDLKDLVDGTYELLYSNVLADVFMEVL